MEQDILSELQKLNSKIDRFTKPSRFVFLNFLGGAARSLGAIFGTLVFFFILAYFLSQINLTKPISQWIESTLSQVKWERVIMPQIQTIETDILKSN